MKRIKIITFIHILIIALIIPIIIISVKASPFVFSEGTLIIADDEEQYKISTDGNVIPNILFTSPSGVVYSLFEIPEEGLNGFSVSLDKNRTSAIITFGKKAEKGEWNYSAITDTSPIFEKISQPSAQESTKETIPETTQKETKESITTKETAESTQAQTQETQKATTEPEATKEETAEEITEEETTIDFEAIKDFPTELMTDITVIEESLEETDTFETVEETSEETTSFTTEETTTDSETVSTEEIVSPISEEETDALTTEKGKSGISPVLFIILGCIVVVAVVIPLIVIKRRNK